MAAFWIRQAFWYQVDPILPSFWVLPPPTEPLKSVLVLAAVDKAQSIETTRLVISFTRLNPLGLFP